MPFQTPQAPSFIQRAERTAIREDEDLRSTVCGEDREAAGGVRGVCA